MTDRSEIHRVDGVLPAAFGWLVACFAGAFTGVILIDASLNLMLFTVVLAIGLVASGPIAAVAVLLINWLHLPRPFSEIAFGIAITTFLPLMLMLSIGRGIGDFATGLLPYSVPSGAVAGLTYWLIAVRGVP